MPIFTTQSDNFVTRGLSGTEDSLSYRIQKIERHFHGHEKWFGQAAAPSGETHVADRISGTTAAFRLTAGNSAFGSWVQILGSSDTPVEAGKVKFDMHRFLVTATTSTAPYSIQIVYGESAAIAAKLAAEDFTGFMYIAASNNNDSGISDVIMRRYASGTKMWARCACIGGNGTTIDFYHGLHEYEG